MVRFARGYRKHVRRKAYERLAGLDAIKRQAPNPDRGIGDGGQWNGCEPGGKGKGKGRPGGPRGPGQGPPMPFRPSSAEQVTTATTQVAQTPLLPTSTTSQPAPVPPVPQIPTATSAMSPVLTTSPQSPPSNSTIPSAVPTTDTLPPIAAPVTTQTTAPVPTQPANNPSPIPKTGTATVVEKSSPPSEQPLTQPVTASPVPTAPFLPSAGPTVPQQPVGAPLLSTSSTLVTSTPPGSSTNVPVVPPKLPSVGTSSAASQQLQNVPPPTHSISTAPTAYPAAESTTPGPLLTTRSKIGIGAGVGMFGLLLSAGIILFFFRRLRKQQNQTDSDSFSGYDPQHTYLGGDGEAGMTANRAMQFTAPLPPSFATRDFGYPEEDRSFGFGDVAQSRGRHMMAPGLRSHPVGTRNTLEDQDVSFAGQVASHSSKATPQDSPAVIGVVRARLSSPSRESLADPDFPFRTRSPSPFAGIVINSTRPSITPSESISRVMEKADTVGAERPSSPIARYVQEATYLPWRASENILRLLGLGRKSAITNISSDPTSVAELPAAPHRRSPSTTPSDISWPMPTGVSKGWLGSVRRKSKLLDDEAAASRWSSTQQSSQFSRSGSPTGSETSRDELITALPEVITALPEMRENRNTRGSWRSI